MGDSGTGKKVKLLGLEHGGQRKEEGERGGEGRHWRCVREEHFTHVMKRCAEEVMEGGCSKNSKQKGQNDEGWSRRTQDVHTRRSMPRSNTRWRSHLSFHPQLLHSPFTMLLGGCGGAGDCVCDCDCDGEGFIGGRFMAMGGCDFF